MPKADPANYPNTTRDRYEYRHAGKKRAVLYGVLIWCPSCRAYKPAVDVGLRTMNGVIYVENNCKQCRNE